MEKWNNQINNISNKWEEPRVQNTNLETQKQEIFDKWDKKEDEVSSAEEALSLIKQDLQLKIEPSEFKKWYTKNMYPLGIEIKVNKEVSTILKPFTLNGVTSTIQEYDGRKFVLAEVDGIEMPFYSSSNGTSGKNKGEWYPFYGFSEEGWVMKDGFNEDNEWEYNREADSKMQEKIKETARFLSENISLPLSPKQWIDNLEEYFDYQEIDTKTPRVEINNALGLPENFDTTGINTNSGIDKLNEIKRAILKNRGSSI